MTRDTDPDATRRTASTSDAGEESAPAGDDAPADAADHACRVCGRPFPDRELLVLHRGVRHASALTAEEREAYRDVYLREEREIRSFRLRALAVLVVVYFGFLFLYAGFAG